MHYEIKLFYLYLTGQNAMLTTNATTNAPRTTYKNIFYFTVMNIQWHQ